MLSAVRARWPAAALVAGALLVLSVESSSSQSRPDAPRPFPFAVARLEIPAWARQPCFRFDLAYCERFLRDLKRAGAVKFLEPIYRAESVEALQNSGQLGKCPVSEFVKVVQYEPKIWDSFKDLPKSERELYGTKWRMSKDFRLYSADIDRNSKNGRELILYGAGMTAKRAVPGGPDEEQIGDLSYFVVLDLRTCEGRHWAQVYDTVHQPAATVGLVEYQGETLVYDTGYNAPESLHGVKFQRLTWIPQRKTFVFMPGCTFIARDAKKNPGVSTPGGGRD